MTISATGIRRFSSSLSSRPLPVTAIAALLLTAALAPSPADAQIIIDSFSTNQSSMVLTFPPAGTSASSSVSGAGIIGGERDIQVSLSAGVIAGNSLSANVSSGFFSYSQDATITGSATLQWDGTDGSANLNPTGLGGIDLTAGGTQDAILLNTAFDDLPTNFVITVYTDAGNVSAATFTMPGLLFSSTNFVIPYSAFITTLGAGANFSNVGAIVMTIGSNVTAPDVVLDTIQTTALISASETVALLNDVNSNSLAEPGDTLRYTAIVNNPTDAQGASATGVVFTNATPPNTTLVIGSVTSTQGAVTTGNTGGDTSVAVNLGSIPDGAVATITFDVVVNNPVPAGVAQVASQGTFTSSGLPGGVLTDDPSLPGAADPTVLAVTSAPGVIATLSAGLITDINSDGQVGPGDTVQYTSVISNPGSQDASALQFASLVDPNTTLVVGSVTTSAGSVSTGNTAGDTSVAVNIGTLAGNGGTATIQFNAVVRSPLPGNVTQISAQGTLTGANISPLQTDNPLTGTPGDPTATPIAAVVLPPAQIPTLDTWGQIMLVLAMLATGLGLTKRKAK